MTGETLNEAMARIDREYEERRKLTEAQWARYDADNRRCWMWVGGILAAFAVGMIVNVFVANLGFHRQVSEGTRVGVVTKLSSRGRFWKSWEADAIVGSIDVPGVGTTWSFTVDPDGPIDAIDSAVRSGHKVRLRYIEWMYGGYVNGDTDYRVVGVEEMPR